jgi:membrane protease YdiL (CAAX protease family)
MFPTNDIRKAAAIIGSIFLFEGFFVALQAYPDPVRLLRWLGFIPGRHGPAGAGWYLATLVTVAFVVLSARLPSVRANLFRPSWLKLLALGMALVSGILEEIFFRSMLMDRARDHGANALLQVLLSSITFGLMHGVWALFRRSWRAGLSAIVATGILGAALAVVYLASGRSLAPCVAAHCLLNALAEPGLVLAAVRGEMGTQIRHP